MKKALLFVLLMVSFCIYLNATQVNVRYAEPTPAANYGYVYNTLGPSSVGWFCQWVKTTDDIQDQSNADGTPGGDDVLVTNTNSTYTIAYAPVGNRFAMGSYLISTDTSTAPNFAAIGQKVFLRIYNATSLASATQYIDLTPFTIQLTPTNQSCNVGADASMQAHLGSWHLINPLAQLSISGSVADNSAAPLAGATISLTGAMTHTTTSAADGSYAFHNLVPGAYTLNCTLEGYTFTSLTINLSADVTGQNFTGVPVVNNHAPVFTSTPVTTAEAGDAYSYSIVATDEDNDTLTLTAVTVPSWLTYTVTGNGAATLTGTPTVANLGLANVALTVNDGTVTVNQSFSITVSNNTDLAPVFTSTPVLNATQDQVYTYNVTTTDADGDAMIITAPTLPAWLTISASVEGTATLTGTPTQANIGSNPVIIQVSDGSMSVQQSFNIVVANVNDGPTIDLTTINPVSFNEDNTATINFAPAVNDPDGDTITLSFTGNSHITVTVTGLSVVFGAEANWNGSENLVATVSDGTLSATANLTVIVNPVNDAPVITAFLPTTTEFNLNGVTNQDFSVTATDIDSDLHYSWYIEDAVQASTTNAFSHQFTDSGTFHVRVAVTDTVATVEQIWTVNVVVGTGEQNNTLVTKLGQNFPNPFNPVTNIRYSLKANSPVQLAIYDVRGHLVKSLVNSNQNAGQHVVTWMGDNDHGQRMASGVYFYRMTAEGKTFTNKMLLVK